VISENIEKRQTCFRCGDSPGDRLGPHGGGGVRGGGRSRGARGAAFQSGCRAFLFLRSGAAPPLPCACPHGSTRWSAFALHCNCTCRGASGRYFFCHLRAFLLPFRSGESDPILPLHPPCNRFKGFYGILKRMQFLK
jgi:hypothetical protein